MTYKPQMDIEIDREAVVDSLNRFTSGATIDQIQAVCKIDMPCQYVHIYLEWLVSEGRAIRGNNLYFPINGIRRGQSGN